VAWAQKWQAQGSQNGLKKPAEARTFVGAIPEHLEDWSSDDGIAVVGAAVVANSELGDVDSETDSVAQGKAVAKERNSCSAPRSNRTASSQSPLKWTL